MNTLGKKPDQARKLLEANAQAVASLTSCLNENFTSLTDAILRCAGNVVVSGIGKAGLIGAKVSATLSATGTPSFFLHPVDALHGDLGRVQKDDVCLLLSYSGNSEEIVRLVPALKKRGAKVAALTGRKDSPLVNLSDWVLCFGEVEEGSPMDLVPSASTTCMMVLGDALALRIMELRKFSVDQLAGLHPLGILGKKMLKVEEVMGFRLGENLPVAEDHLTVRDVLTQVSKIKRRCGAVLLINDKKVLSGIFTDGDLRRLLEDKKGDTLDLPVSRFMTSHPKSIRTGSYAAEALALIQKFRIDELPVVDGEGRPVGLIDVQDFVGLGKP